MKKIIYIMPVLFSLFISCQTEKIDLPELEVSTDSTTYHVGDTVIFHLNGNPDIISFYSGEPGNAYEFANQDRIVESTTTVSFQTQNRSQTYVGIDAGSSYCQDNQLKVKISTDFNGKMNSDSVKSATWIDITDKFSLGPLSCSSSSSYIAAGTVDLTQYLADEQPFYFAFEYINRPNKDFGNSNIWRFSNFAITAVSDAGSVNIASQSSALWSPVFVGESWDPVRGFSSTTTVVTMRADPAYRDIEQELWCISAPLKVDKVINVGADISVPIKAVSEIPLTTYNHTFKKTGSYTVTFLAANSNIYDRKEVIRQIQITVEP